MECAKLGVPVYVEVDAMPGATSPVTLADTLVEQNANVLTGICLAQMIRPGLPSVYSLATVQLAHPSNLSCQAGYERGLQMLTASCEQCVIDDETLSASAGSTSRRSTLPRTCAR